MRNVGNIRTTFFEKYMINRYTYRTLILGLKHKTKNLNINCVNEFIIVYVQLF